MKKLFYLANVRMPTEKAHGLQICQNCEAFAKQGLAVTLLPAHRINTKEMAAVADLWAHYGVRANFAVRHIPSLDLFPLIERFSGKAAFFIQVASYTLALFLIMLFRRADLYYSRDIYTLLALSLIKPRQRLVYEAHQRAKSGIGARLQKWCVRRVGLTVAVTAKLAEALAEAGAKKTLVAHDGFRPERFAGLPSRAEVRATLQLPADAFIAGYVGRLHTMQMSKGVDTLVEAIGQCERPIYLCLVGGPDAMAESLRQQWLGLGLPADRFLYAGQVAPTLVPPYLAAFDLCTMPFPFTEHFAYYASPLKLFEYMAVGGVIVGSDLPSAAEVIANGENGLLTAPGDAAELAGALRQLYDDPELRRRLAAAALATAKHYTWDARAESILQAWQPA
jgi:glycosyltransferase involved in cell wall biosynthesis